ncbi:mitochondrial F1-F0 ATP synthase subunit F of fungi-domain-containing protein [Melampsora americana]|nr:mitochondrial F1-F0 ATP synthase subunit F of fungi-domain-containing protein [Melampsora americana]
MSSALKNLIPPKIASVQALSGTSTATRMKRVVEFYSKLPKGSIDKSASTSSVGLNPFNRYKAKYIDGENASATPLVHAILGLFLVGYTIEYNMHLKFHKNNHH